LKFIYKNVFVWEQKFFGKPNWIEKPLSLDLTNTKVIQAIQLLKEVVEVEEHNRIVADHNLSLTPIKK